MSLGTILTFIVGLVVLAIIASAIKIVPEYKRLIILRLGSFIGVRGPGLVLRIPLIDQIIWVDLRENYFEIPHQTCITEDNAPTDIDFVVYFKVVDPALSVLNVANFKGAALALATTTLRAVIGEMQLDEVLAKRDDINQILRVKLDEVTERWGVKITNVEIREILPPKQVQEAMIKQMAAERDRRAMITEAEGKKTSAILIAEGEKQAAILKAEGQKQATILKAEGYAEALRTIFSVAREIDVKTMRLQYLDTLKEIAASPSTKIVLPMQLVELVKDFLGKEKLS
ncbi:MAG: SPFH/Band 7/PHB domain protein [Thermoproteota archaeon]|nr:MAG: SPFH/Band 7/PHB domain protein [Candidatus Korarchaeota archaeon]RLG46820.1 MAG: SPFH/Band 7/PHB domain protein [Candidatus Korarchaeota archaeon]